MLKDGVDPLEVKQICSYAYTNLGVACRSTLQHTVNGFIVQAKDQLLLFHLGNSSASDTKSSSNQICTPDTAQMAHADFRIEHVHTVVCKQSCNLPFCWQATEAKILDLIKVLGSVISYVRQDEQLQQSAAQVIEDLSAAHLGGAVSAGMPSNDNVSK